MMHQPLLTGDTDQLNYRVLSIAVVKEYDLICLMLQEPCQLQQDSVFDIVYNGVDIGC